ncbi:MAG: hypothetical protein ACFB0A_01480 [Croceivirga sp.]
MKRLNLITILTLTVAAFVSCNKRYNQNETQEKATFHEFNDSTIITSNIVNTEYSSSIIINPKLHKLEPQHLMSSQNYDSNYAVYVTLHTTPVSLDTSKFKLHRADFEIKNYKAKVFMGIHKVVVETPSPQGSLKFGIYVRAMNKVMPKYPLPFSSPLELNLGGIMKTERYLMPMNIEGKQISKDSCDVLKRNVLKGETCCYCFSNRLGNFVVKPDNGRIVDTEFFFVDGSFVQMKASYDERKYPKSKDPGERCKTGTNKMM